jgi:hypothetical protein
MLQAPDTVCGVHRAIARPGSRLVLGHFSDTSPCLCSFFVQTVSCRHRGSCPYPYSTDRAGRKCGARSAYSKPGGASPICYETDVTHKMVDDYRKKSKQ